MIQKFLNAVMLLPTTLLVYPGIGLRQVVKMLVPFLKRPHQNLPLDNIVFST